MLVGTLLVVGGLVVLSGGSGLPGIVNDPVGDPPIGEWVVGAGTVIALIASWGMWTGWSMRRLTRGPYISALLFCGVWIILGLLRASIATSPVPRRGHQHCKRRHTRRPCSSVVVSRGVSRGPLRLAIPAAACKPGSGAGF
jgi:hypothetical protein